MMVNGFDRQSNKGWPGRRIGTTSRPVQNPTGNRKPSTITEANKSVIEANPSTIITSETKRMVRRGRRGGRGPSGKKKKRDLRSLTDPYTLGGVVGKIGKRNPNHEERIRELLSKLGLAWEKED